MEKSVGEINCGSRERLMKGSARKRKQLERNTVNIDIEWKPKCSHSCRPAISRGKTCVFKCNKVTTEDVGKFRSKIFESSKKDVQDKQIARFMVVEKPRRQVFKGAKLRKEHTTVYKIRDGNGALLTVCQSLFLEAAKPLTRRRLNLISKKLLKNETLDESRGGDRKAKAFASKRASVISFISRLQGRESHYSRAKSCRIYLASEMKSIRKLWKIYNRSQDKVSYCFFSRIFKRKFNIGFANPRVDVCTSCEKMKNQLRFASGTEKTRILTDLTVHKRRASAFYEMLRSKEHLVHTVCFDLQQVQSLPKVPVQEAFYSRQMGVYNFGLCDITKEVAHCYTWLESEAGRGSNEIASAVYHYLSRDLIGKGQLRNATKLRLCSDGCGAQYKNSAQLKQVELVFPVRGHSFLPCDRMFGRIEKDLRCRDTIVMAEEYQQIFKQHCNEVLVLGKDWDLQNWKQVQSTSMKKVLKLQAAKRIICYRSDSGQCLVRTEEYYKSNTGVGKNLILQVLCEPQKLPLGRPLSEAKLKDIRNLLSVTYGDWEVHSELKLYRDLTSSEDAENDALPFADCSCLQDDIGLRI